jgi:hypothetical protein
LPPISERERKIRSGTSGPSERPSIRTNVASRATEPASRPIVCGLPQPASGASAIANTSASTPAVTVTAPARSKQRTQSGSTLSGRSRGVSASSTSLTGTLMKKIHSQPSASVIGPPISRPAVAPMPPIPPQIPSALLATDHRQRGDDDRPVENHHEERRPRQRKRPPTSRIGGVGSLAHPERTRSRLSNDASQPSRCERLDSSSRSPRFVSVTIVVPFSRSVNSTSTSCVPSCPS